MAFLTRQTGLRRRFVDIPRRFFYSWLIEVFNRYVSFVKNNFLSILGNLFFAIFHEAAAQIAFQNSFSE